MANVVTNTFETDDMEEQKKNERKALERLGKLLTDRKAKAWRKKKDAEEKVKDKIRNIAKNIAANIQTALPEAPKINTEDDDFWNLDSSDDDEPPKVKKSLKLDNMKKLPLKEVSKAQTKPTVKQAQVPVQNSSDSPFIVNSPDDFNFDWSSDETQPPSPPKYSPPKPKKEVQKKIDNYFKVGEPKKKEEPKKETENDDVDSVDIEKRFRPENYNEPLTKEELDLFNHNNLDGALEERQVNAYIKVIKKKFAQSKKSKNKWLIEDCYYFEDMKPPIGSNFLKKLKSDCKKYTRIFFPMLTFNSWHWVGVMLDTKKHMVIIMEPTITRTDFTEYFQVLQKALLDCGTGYHWGVDYKKDISHQWDKYNCGIFTLKNISDMVLNGKTKIYTSDDKKDVEKNRKILISWRNQFKNEIINLEGAVSKKDLNNGEVQEISSSSSQSEQEDDELNINSPEVINFKPPIVLEEDLKMLDRTGGDGMLDDKILEAGFKVLRQKITGSAKIEDVYFLNILNNAEENPRNRENNKVLSDFKKDIDTYDRIYFPINYQGVHWILIMADNTDNTLNIYDSEHHTDYDKETKNLRLLFKRPHGVNYEIIYHSEVPLQTDSYNCGMFVLKNIECLELNGGVFNYEQGDLIRERKKLKQELINMCGGTVMDKKTFEKLSMLRKYRNVELNRRKLKEEKQIL